MLRLPTMISYSYLASSLYGIKPNILVGVWGMLNKFTDDKAISAQLGQSWGLAEPKNNVTDVSEVFTACVSSDILKSSLKPSLFSNFAKAFI